jgi:hypothetical protein
MEHRAPELVAHSQAHHGSGTVHPEEDGDGK